MGKLMSKLRETPALWPSIGKFRFWLAHVSQSMPRSYSYHYGLLARDRGQLLTDGSSSLLGGVKWVVCEEVDAMATLAWEAQARGEVVLVQRRFEPMWYEYIAIRCEQRGSRAEEGGVV